MIDMTARIIDGSAISKVIRAELKNEVIELKEKYNVVPGLAGIIVGDDPASQVYFGQKERAAEALGIYSEKYALPGTSNEDDVLRIIDKLNKNNRVSGVLVQLPLPKQFDENRIILAIDPAKDVDGQHPVNLGKLMAGNPDVVPCTPFGIQELLIRSGVPIAGSEVVIVCRSNLVGKPIANILLQKKENANATVTVCHTGTKDLAVHTRKADILVVATGHVKTITADMVKPGAVVIDVGVNRIGKSDSGKDILVGDVDFNSVKEVAGMITPVPGGVGPMTVTMLMVNTVRAARAQNGLSLPDIN
jgi:methylenetetrahydrofolate dehydrogenase (NADP+) / methenyltetrahydrofolate cyclohydrolase